MTETNYIYAQAHFAFKSDTIANWKSINPILLSGEFGVVIDGNETEKVKIGDGVTPWNELSWWMGPKGDTGPQGPQGVPGEKGNDGVTPIIDQTYDPDSKNAQSGLAVASAIDDAIVYLNGKAGDIETALDSIIAIQNSLIGGDS